MNKYETLNKTPDGKSRDDETIASLQKELARTKERNREERFCWALSLIVLLDVFFFTSTNGWGAPIVLLFLQVILLIILARRWGVEDLTDVLDRYVFNHPMNPFSKNTNKE